MTQRLLGLKEAAELLQIYEDELEELVEKGIVPAYRIGGCFIRFKQEDLEKVSPRIKKTRKDGDRIFTQQLSLPGFKERVIDFFYRNTIYLILIILGVMAVLSVVVRHPR